MANLSAHMSRLRLREGHRRLRVRPIADALAAGRVQPPALAR
jgi:hypothetical protein